MVHGPLVVCELRKVGDHWYRQNKTAVNRQLSNCLVDTGRIITLFPSTFVTENLYNKKIIIHEIRSYLEVISYLIENELRLNN